MKLQNNKLMEIFVIRGKIKMSIDTLRWKYIKPLKSADSILNFEKQYDYTYPDEFKTCVLINNGGRTNRCVFKTKSGREYVMKSLLSFNKDDRENVWNIRQFMFNKYLPFAIDNFGNMICFNIVDDSVVFINCEIQSVEYIADDFVKFLNLLS